MKETKLALQTRAIHAGRMTPRVEGAAVTPIFQRTYYRRDEAPVRKVERFVTNDRIVW